MLGFKINVMIAYFSSKAIQKGGRETSNHALSNNRLNNNKDLKTTMKKKISLFLN